MKKTYVMCLSQDVLIRSLEGTYIYTDNTVCVHRTDVHERYDGVRTNDIYNILSSIITAS